MLIVVNQQTVLPRLFAPGGVSIVVKPLIKNNKMNLDLIKKTSDELLKLLPLKSRNILIARFGLNGN
jgi:hypothetical protein